MSDTAKPDLITLAEAYGITTEYEDWKKRKVLVSAETLVAVLAALDVDASTPETIRRAVRERQARTQGRVLPACLVVQEGETIVVPVAVDDDVTGVTLKIETEQGEAVEGHPVISRRSAEDATSFDLGDALPLGYHRIVATLSTGEGAREETSTLIVTPAKVPTPAAMGERRIWGLATQLYSVRSHASWGVGDIVDLRDLAVWSAGEHDADYVLVNPLHAAQAHAPMEPSPYLPTSRRFVNPLYLRVEQIAEYATAPDGVRAAVQVEAARVHERLDDVDRIERDAAWAAKEAALRAVFAVTRTPGREIAFRTWWTQMGEQLTRFATWCVLSREFGADWNAWPEQFRRADSPAVVRYREEHASEVEFYAWLQWCLDEQLREAQSSAQAAGMALGIVHDLAVGVDPRGADAWALGDVFARGIHVGAPPDQFTQLGQDWGQPPLRPDRLEETAYQPFRDMVASILRHAGGVRIDHILGLFRLWWVPEGKDPTHGTYVRYDHDAMIGILALEAQRAGALVVGEDLGTVEAWVQDVLAERGLYGTSILWFEQDWDAERPLPPSAWREMCLASVTTHDLPPTAGYLEGAHVRLRDELGLLTEPLETEMARDEADRRRWREFLVDQGLLDSADADDERVIVALHEFLVTTPSRMLNLALVDAVGDKRVQNQPGTADEYPNWRVPLTGPDGDAVWLDDVFTSERVARLCAVFAALSEPDPTT